MAGRLARPGSGSHPQSLRERTDRYGAPDLARYLGAVPFVVVGGLATRRYMAERMTLDADVLVLPARLPEAESALQAAGCRKLGALTIGGSTWLLPEGTNLDVIALPDPWTEEAIAGAARGDDNLPYVSLPFLVVMKLASGRVQDLADIARMLGVADDGDLRRVREIVQKFRPRDMEDLESIIRLGRLEHDLPPDEAD